MTMNAGRRITELRRMTVTQLRRKHIEAFGEPTGSRHKNYLVKRGAWRLQAQEAGDLFERASRIRGRAEQLANDADLRTTAPKHPTHPTLPYLIEWTRGACPAAESGGALPHPAFRSLVAVPLPVRYLSVLNGEAGSPSLLYSAAPSGLDS